MDSAAEFTALAQQHLQLLATVERLWTAVAILAFLGLLFILVIFATAIWSVRAVNRRQASLEGKFELLIDVLLKQAERDIEAQIGN